MSIESIEDFQQRISFALAKVDRMSQLPEEELAKCFKRKVYKSELRDYYFGLIQNPVTDEINDETEESEES